MTPTTSFKATITALTHDGRGIAHINGKTTFIENALPGEEVLFSYSKKHNKYDEGKTTEILKPSTDRVIPLCQHYGICGGCALQHLSNDAQLNLKQKTLLEQLKHFGGVEPEILLPALRGPLWGYRRRGRLGAKYVTKKQSVLVGFREKNGRYLADLKRCEVLDPKVGTLLVPLQNLIAGLKAFQHIPQIEIAISDDTTGLVFRHLTPLDINDLAQLKNFAQAHHIQLYLQPGDTQSIHCIWPEKDPKQLFYRLPEQRLELAFNPSDFTQINSEINRKMVNLALELLEPKISDRILDLFCGLGNFTLAIAQHCSEVVGIEGSAALVAQAQKNALHNNIHNAFFYEANLASDSLSGEWTKQNFNKILLDPPRTGALEIIQNLPKWNIERIVYVSCNPATLARDAGELAKQGYRLFKAGIMDMFPHTHHVEAISLFIKSTK